MRYLVTAGEMRRYDANTTGVIGIPGLVLMERAALAAAEFLMERFPDGRGRVLVMAGVGNNGGDGLALARILSESGFAVDVWIVGDTAKASGQWMQQRRILQYTDVNVCDTAGAGEYIILVDALFGVGLGREVKGIYAEAVETFNGMRGFKLALDVPSGVDSDTGKVLGCAVKADAVMSFGLCKRGLLMYPGSAFTGEIFLADIGITEKSFLGEKPEMFCYESLAEAIPGRDPAGNKGTFGKMLLVAGNRKMAGAAVLAAKAAYRAGAGMVKVTAHEDNRVILQEMVPEALFGTAEDLEDSIRWADVIVVGPGLGKDEWAAECLGKTLEVSEKPLVIDADGLNILAEDYSLSQRLEGQRRMIVLTPHVGELSRLTGATAAALKEGLWLGGMSLAERFSAVVAAKDARTYICAQGQPVCMNVLGNSGMATAGSGDVLAGVIGGMLAQTYGSNGNFTDDMEEQREAVFRAVCQGVVLHAAAGDLAALQKGEHGCMAGDIAEAVAEVLKDGRTAV